MIYKELVYCGKDKAIAKLSSPLTIEEIGDLLIAMSFNEPDLNFALGVITKFCYDENIEWMNSQGPICNGLLEYLDANEQVYKKIIFMTYLYFTTFWGLQKHADKSILIPTAHDEPPIYLNIFKEFFNKPSILHLIQ